MNKIKTHAIVWGAIAIVLLGIVGVGGFGYNEDPNFTVIQYPWGSIAVKDANGMFVKMFGKTDVYPDMDIIYFSKDAREGSEIDESIETLFVDKGKGWWSFQVAVRNPNNKPDQIEFHRLCKGDYDYFRNTINARLKSAGRKFSEKATASEAAEGQSTFVVNVENEIKSDGMILNEFHSSITAVELVGVEFDENTRKLFAKQQEALLLKKQAELDSQKFVQQTLSTKAEYEQKIAQQKGEADMIAMKAVTDAEREAKLATIEAQRKVDVASLEKAQADEIRQKMEIDANAKLRVAEIERAQAEQKAEAVKLLAKAEQERIQLAGAITEKEQVALTINKERDIGVATAWANGNRLTPDFIIGGTGGDGSGDLHSTLFTMKLMDSMGLLNSTNAPFASK